MVSTSAIQIKDRIYKKSMLTKEIMAIMSYSQKIELLKLKHKGKIIEEVN